VSTAQVEHSSQPVETVGFALPADNSACPKCAGTLAFHQPDSDEPELFVGVCQICRRWWAMAVLTDLDTLAAVDLSPVIERLKGDL
jgi:hypothetical protein